MPVGVVAARAFGPSALAFPAVAVRCVHVELHGQALGHEVLGREGAGQLDPVLSRQHPVGRQRQHDLAGDLAVLALLGRLRRVPQCCGVGQAGIRAVGQQHLVVLGGLTMAEVEQLAGALGRDRLAGVVGRRPHGVAARGAGQVARTGEGNGHGGTLPSPAGLLKQRCPCNAYCV